MNAIRTLSAVTILLAGQALAAPALPERIQVSWAPTEQLSEVKDNPFQHGWLRPKDWMQSLSEYLRKRADYVLPQGQHLDVTITDIKLAGAYEPWRRSELQEVRFLTDLHPPRIDLHYRLSASDGSTIREGDSKLRDNAYLQRTVANQSDSLAYDKRLIDDWLRREFAAPRS
jgi:DUF3016 family protein